MKYLLLICADEDAEVAAEDGPDVAAATASWAAEMDGRGVRLDGERLRPSADATTVRVREGELRIWHGPQAGSELPIAGYDVIECADLDEAIEVAGKHPVVRFGAIDVRPVWCR
ncbi:YciI family protein [Actinospica robiniae]|uniref:YciI family protein n=1 Tax=Actinospica robiniae TaxID=304901 RepID=UPI000553A671|nr:YciI family protein [Actinospica robiniae]